MTQWLPSVLHVVSHPIQYFVPLYRQLTADARLKLTVAYGSRLGLGGQLDPDFGHKLRWDIPMLGGYRAVFLDDGGVTFPDVIRRLWRLARSESFDAVWIHGYTPLLSIAAISIARVMGIPVLLRDEANLDQHRTLLRRLARRAIFKALFPGTVFLSIGTRNREHWLNLGVPANRIVNTPYTVDNAFFAAAASRITKSEARERFKLPGEVPVALFAGKLVEKKDPMILVAAMRLVQQQRRVALLVVGDGNLRSRVERRAVLLGLTDIVFTGFLNQSEMPLAYAAADFLVLPSLHHETWGLVVNEAMNFGLPAIVSNRVGCADDLVVEGATGFVFPAGESSALADRILISCEPAQLNHLGATARLHIASWDIGQTAKGIEQAVRIATLRR